MRQNLFIDIVRISHCKECTYDLIETCDELSIMSMSLDYLTLYLQDTYRDESVLHDRCGNIVNDP